MMKVKPSIFMAASVLAMLATTGCKREAGGQVVAVVNGDEITRQELDAELNGKELPQNVDAKTVRQMLLQTVVKRHLLAGAARADGLDKDQEYLLKQQRSDDTLLVDMIGERAARTFRVPDNAAIDKYVTDHPQLFAQRQIYQFDELLFPLPSDIKQIQKLKDDHSMDAVAATLTSLGIKYSRGTGQLDSAVVPPELIDRIKKLPAGEPFLLPRGNAIAVGVLTGSTPAPVSVEEARPIAVQFMRKDAVEKALKDRLKTAKAEAKIDYQPGYAPSAAVQKQSGL